MICEFNWEQLFLTPSILASSIARLKPERGLVSSNLSGVYQLYAWDVYRGDLRQLTNCPEGIMFGTLSPDGRYVCCMEDTQGNEIGHYVRIPFEGGDWKDLTPELPLYSSSNLVFSPDGSRIGFIANDADGFHFICIDNKPGGLISPTRKIYQSKKMIYGPIFSCDSEIAVIEIAETTGSRNYNLLALDTDNGEEIGYLSDGPENEMAAVKFSPVTCDKRLMAITNRSGFKRPIFWNPCTGERIDLSLDGYEGDVIPLDWSPDGKYLLLCQYCCAMQRLFLYDLLNCAHIALNHPRGSFGAFAGMAGLIQEAYFAPTGEIWAHWQDATNPPQLIALDSHCEQGRTVLAVGESYPSHPWESITFNSSDGQAVQGWLALPEGEKPFPTVLFAHGGPGAVATECYSPESQTWLDHGFAFLSVNYRSSTTFGRDFLDCIWGNPGHWEVEDMVAAHNWLVHEGIARPDQVLLTGSSYGGYVTLLAVGKYPDIWAGGVASIAITDWAIQYEDATEGGRKRIEALFEGTPAQKPDVYAASSPVTYVDRIHAPVLIIQARNDMRAPPRQIDLFEEKMKTLGKYIEIHWFDAGHMGRLAQVERCIEHQKLMLQFADHCLRLKGRPP